MDSLINIWSMQVSSNEVATFVPDKSASSKISLDDDDDDDPITDPITQPEVTWGLARISHRKTNYKTAHQYPYNSTAGAGINVYVLASGIYTEHPQFEGRASFGACAFKDCRPPDTNGQGTHIAGTVASSEFGVAKKSNVIAVKVLDDNLKGNTFNYIYGLEWAIADHQKRSAAARAGEETTGFRASVIFLNPGFNGNSYGKNPGTIGKSLCDKRLGFDYGDMKLIETINAAIDAGIPVVVPAGNGDGDICSTAIFQSKAVIVGASERFEQMSYFSNPGSCITLFAPGSAIRSTYVGDYESWVLYGTETAAAHVAGLLAYLQSLQPEVLAPADLKSMLVRYATQGALSKVPDGTPNVSRKKPSLE